MASTAMIQHEIDVPLHLLVAIKGIGPTQRVWQRKAAEGLDALVRLQGLECQFARKRTLYLAGENYGSRALKAESAARWPAANVPHVDLLAYHPVPKSRTHAV